MPKQPVFLFFMCFLLLSALGCAGRGRITSVPIPSADPKAYLKTVTIDASDFSFLSGDARLKILSPKQNLTARAIFFLEKNTRMHIQLLNVFHQPQLFLLADRQNLQMYVPSENRLYYGDASADHISRLTGTPLEVSDLLNIFAGQTPGFSLKNTGHTIHEEDHFLVFTLTRGSQKTVIRIDRRLNRITKYSDFTDGHIQMDIDYSDFKQLDRHLFPTRIKMTIPEKKFTLTLDFKSLEFTPFSEDLFKLNLPLNVMVQPFPGIKKK